MRTDRIGWRRVAVVFAVGLGLLIAGSAPSEAVAAPAVVAAPTPVDPPARVQYRPPVNGTVVDPYRPPAGPYGPGNRGIDLASEPGGPVVSPADGVVTFAGQVGGQLFVVVRHADGVRTTMGTLASVTVVAGQRVGAGQQVGTTGGRLHFGARVGKAYIDPNLLLARGRLRLTA